MTAKIKKIVAESYTLRDENDHWLGQVVLTNDGMFASLTDWGNFSYAWRHHGRPDFKTFLTEISVDYFAEKMITGMAYVVRNKSVDSAARRFAKKILPPLQEKLKFELAV